ncbi:MAG: flagellar filament capping protein FliD [Ruminococcus sp.]|nr:flagellar filament capping protein FliD [Ruminococcus sp.]
MSSVGSLSTSTSTSIRGYGGLASGLDRDQLIEGMTIGTTTKINKQEQKKQQIEWMQEAVRSISDKMISFHGKYTETLTSPTNLFSSMLWGRNKITTLGKNSSKVSVSGTANSADAITIMGVKQKAENAKWSSTGRVSEGKAIESGTIDITNGGKDLVKENLEGKTIEFNYGGKDYSITLSASDKYDYTTADGIANAINDLLSKQTTSDDKKLSDIVKVTVNNNYLEFNDIGSGSNSVSVSGGSALYLLGLSNDKEGEDIIRGGGFNKNEPLPAQLRPDELVTKQTFAEYVGGKSLTFSYNGSSGTVQIPGAKDLEARVKAIQDKDGSISDNDAAVKAIAESIQEQLNKTFGKGRIEVSGDNGKLTFKTTLPEGGDDSSSILSITGGSTALVGANKGVLGLSTGQTTRTELNTKIDANTLANLQKETRTETDKDGNTVTKKGFMLNDEFIEVKDNATIKDIMNSINNSNANITVSYQEAADKFTFVSNDNGASGVIDFSGNDADTLGALTDVFGLEFTDEDGNSKVSARGQDAVVSIRYAGSDDIVDIRRDSNTFTVDGLTIAVKGTFGTYENGKLVVDEDDAVEISATVDTDKLVNTIKSFVDEYNAIVDLVNSELTTKHEKDYTPLSSEQKSELSEDEIEKWEAKAKAGLLYGDSDLRQLSMDLRTVATSYVWKLQEIGISVSSTYSDNGKLSVDESKLRAALESDPESVEKLFTSKAGVDEDGNPVYNGIATNLKSVMEKYVKTTGAMQDKGVLIRKAGSKSSAISMTDNTYYNQLKSVEKLIDSLNDRLKTERDRYIKQFTSLETLISNMNSQASYLSSMSGY